MVKKIGILIIATIMILIAPSFVQGACFGAQCILGMSGFAEDVNGGNVAANLVDHNYGTFWQDADSADLDTYFGLYNTSGAVATINNFQWWEYSGSYIPQNFTVKVSNDSTDGSDGSWTTLHTVIANAQTNLTFNFSNDNPHKWYKIHVTDWDDGIGKLAIRELEGWYTAIPYNLTINATDVWDGTNITNFSAIINGTYYNTNNNIIQTEILRLPGSLINITIFNATNHANRTYTNYNISTNLAAQLVRNNTVWLTTNVRSGIDNSLITSVNCTDNHTGTNTVVNPRKISIYEYLNLTVTSRNINLTCTDLNYEHIPLSTIINVTYSNRTHNVTMTPNQLTLAFVQSGNPYNTSGYIADVNKTRYFNTTPLVIYQTNLSQGRIHVRFNTASGLDWWQYYEYDNDESAISETLTVLDRGIDNLTAHFQVMDYSNNPLEDAIIRMHGGYHNLNESWTTFGLLGQRLTDSDGITFFFAESRSEIVLTITKSGYESKQVSISIGDESFTRAAPIPINLKDDDSSNWTGTYAWAIKTIDNKSEDITGTVLALIAGKVEVATQYRLDSGLDPYDITTTEDSLNRYYFTLRSGTDYTDTNNNNITLLIYINDELQINRTIEYITTKTEYFTLPTIDQKLLNPIMAVAIIIISLTFGLLFKSETAGITAFGIGSIIAGAINSQFLWLLMLIIVYYVGTALKKVISE